MNILAVCRDTSSPNDHGNLFRGLAPNQMRCLSCMRCYGFFHSVGIPVCTLQASLVLLLVGLPSTGADVEPSSKQDYQRSAGLDTSAAKARGEEPIANTPSYLVAKLMKIRGFRATVKCVRAIPIDIDSPFGLRWNLVLDGTGASASGMAYRFGPWH
ncbi:uncharacterized protein EI90DRAFT_286407 [Cantharellus anzutake]|uniref:uncharacterized protein n=1 Tax=Cantharellus anzutake TaxID=1750568 RepID=UPI001907F573|nr:uncharacterized protein EI90DRAFT_145558 [Cantharellus anzutake]XP_038919046.1 uncharacterized protein EI90DRAFT_286407 [Cantharellus anzutake]KAF8317536.1 hypothetical protein EI90DRAFT_145558 [Cantharellus anzutake]KAF8335993.1 hypothetical protein EI90DRAFT_286407 [Cantharellus anzutake]